MNARATDSISGSDIAKTINELGTNGRWFQFSELRRALHVTPLYDDKVVSARIYNYLNELKKWGVVEVVSNDRKRYKYFRIANEARLREYLGPVLVVASPTDSPPSKTTSEITLSLPSAGRLTRIEDEIERVREDIRELRERLDQLGQRVDELAAICS